MLSIFKHTDRDGDEIDVRAIGKDDRDYPGTLMFRNTGKLDDTGTMISSSLDRDEVLRLHAALGEWLHPVHTPEGPNRSLIEQMIERAVKDQVAAVLPLHLSQGGAIRISGPCKGHVDAERDHDPEPGDVGHPRPATEPNPQLCKGCSKGNHPHTFSDCAHCDCKWTKSEPQEHGRLMAELPRRTRPKSPGPCDERPPVGARIAHVHDCGYIWGAHMAPEAFIPKCPDCGHGWAEHYSSFCWAGEDPEGCRCTRERPASVLGRGPEYCTECAHSWARHGVGAGPCNVRTPGGECGCGAMRP